MYTMCHGPDESLNHQNEMIGMNQTLSLSVMLQVPHEFFLLQKLTTHEDLRALP